jgi:hypothetical protein
LPNFESRIRSNRLSVSMSARSSPNASLTRRPVQASSPTNVSMVAARSGGLSVLAAVISAAISASL